MTCICNFFKLAFYDTVTPSSFVPCSVKLLLECLTYYEDPLEEVGKSSN